MIDIVDALDLLNGCVQERGESWLPARDESSPSASLRYEAGRPVMDGMVSRALANAGTPPTPCRWLIHSSVVDAYAVGQNPFNLTWAPSWCCVPRNRASEAASLTSACASSIPATSANVTRSPEG